MDNFKKAVNNIRNLKSLSTNEELLVVYGLFKQATIGDCNTVKPGGLFNQKAKYKWEYWNKFKGKSKEWCKKAYYEYYLTLKNKYDIND